MENETREYEILEEKANFVQRLNRDEMIHFNYYLIESRGKNTIFYRVIGVFIAFLGVLGIIQSITEQKFIVSETILNVVCILCGIYFFFFLNALSIKLQKKAVRKKIDENFKELVMKVVVNDEGIGFELIDDEQKEEIVEGVALEENDETTEQEEITNPTEDEEPEEVEAETCEETEVEPVQDEPNSPNVFTIPWGGIMRIDDDGDFMFINMVGYQALVIKKADCPNIDEVVEYAKEKLQDEKRYREI